VGLKTLILVGIILLSTVSGFAAMESAEDLIRVRATPESPHQLAALSQYEAYGVSEIPPHRLGRSYEFELPSHELEGFLSSGFLHEILSRNRNVWDDKEYFSYQEVHETLLSVVAQYPHLAVMENLGFSTRDSVIIWGLKLSDNPHLQEDEPDVLLNAVIHAREPVNANILMAFIEEMTTGYGSDPEITMLMDNTEIWVIPILNPEGYLYVETGIPNPWWRKNKRDNDEDDEFEGVLYEYCGTAFPSFPDGVDLNRNYQQGWSDAGSSMQCSIVYRGPSYFSENESMLEQRLFAREQMVAAISFHSYSEYVGYCGNDPAGIQLCQDLADSILKESGTSSYDAEFFYGSGQSYWWMHAEHGTQAYLIETATEFFPTGAARIASIVENNLNGIRTLLNRVHGAGISGHVFEAGTSKPLVAEVAISGEPQINNPRMSEPVHGRFSRLLLPGNYTVTASLEGYHDAVIEDVVVQEGAPSWVDIPLVPIMSGAPEAPERLSLQQNHPNPFNPRTTIHFTLDRQQQVTLTVYNMAGRPITVLTDMIFGPGQHTAHWNGLDSAGLAVASGTYLLRLQTEDRAESQKIMLVK
jgi:hypothetical protein